MSEGTQGVFNPVKFYLARLMLGGAVGVAVRRWTCDHLSRGFESHRGHLHNNLGQVVHTYVPVSPSSINWYRLKDGDGLPLGR